MIFLLEHLAMGFTLWQPVQKYVERDEFQIIWPYVKQTIFFLLTQECFIFSLA